MYLLRLQPILPLISRQDIAREAAIGYGVAQNTIREALGADHPPVVQNASDESHIPVRAMLGGEKYRYRPERLRLISTQRNLLEILGNQPAHEPTAPEQFLQDRDVHHTAQHPEQNEHRAGLDSERE